MKAEKLIASYCKQKTLAEQKQSHRELVVR